MPRLSIYHPSAAGSAYGWNEPIDYCSRCYPTLLRAQATWGYEVDMDNEHPDYVLDTYTCESCGRVLGTRDN